VQETSVKEDPARADQRLIERVGLYALLVNLALSGLNVAMAAVSGSLALTASAVDSVTDVISSLAVWAGLRLSQHRSRTFPYGLYKIENVSSVIVALLIFVAGYEVARAALRPEMMQPRVTIWVVAGAVAGVVVPLIFGGYAKGVGERTGSPSLLAEGEHRRVDALSSLVVVVAVGASYLGWAVDRWAAAVVVIFIARSGWELLTDGMRVLLDASLEPETLARVREIIDAEPGVVEVQSLTGRNSGRYRFLEAEVGVRVRDVERAHVLSQRLETRIKAQIGRVDRVVIHCEPRRREFTRYALPLTDLQGTISEHFGEAAYFALVDLRTEGGEEQRREVVANPHRTVSKAKGIRVAEWLMGQEVDVVLAKESLSGKGPEYAFTSAGVEMSQIEADTVSQALSSVRDRR
jgi:cation diffusion facilitator family transporter